MSLTNNRRVPGSFTNVIVRAAVPSMSGTAANGRNFTTMTPSAAGMGVGNGSFVDCPFAGACMSRRAAIKRKRNIWSS
jgi:hypothetical protein